MIPDLIEAGIDILNPVQASAAEMETKRLKKEFGDALVFWGGGCDTHPPENITAMYEAVWEFGR